MRIGGPDPTGPALLGMRALRLVAETLFMTTLLHALAALVLGNFRFPPFFERAHSDFENSESRFNHLIRCVATYFFAALVGVVTASLNLPRNSPVGFILVRSVGASSPPTVIIGFLEKCQKNNVEADPEHQQRAKGRERTFNRRTTVPLLRNVTLCEPDDPHKG